MICQGTTNGGGILIAASGFSFFNSDLPELVVCVVRSPGSLHWQSVPAHVQSEYVLVIDPHGAIRKDTHSLFQNQP